MRVMSRSGAAEANTTDAGYSLVECVAALAVLLSVSALAAPLTTSVADTARARQAAGFVASRFRLARQQAALTGAAEAIVFDVEAGRWRIRVCKDGNGNGVRRAEFDGADRCPEGPHDLATLFPGVRIERDPSIPDPSGGLGSTDPVRFGSSDIASFSPVGTGTAGTLYLLSAEGVQYAVRVAGVNGRTRILRYDQTPGRWREI
jgi:type II secretory pathway pseudopilin PulG